jgi:hypothetical protein
LGQFRLEELLELWEYLAGGPTLGSSADVHRGIEWEGLQAIAFSRQPKKGFRRGLHKARGVLEQFYIRPEGVVFLDCNPESLRGNAINYPWEDPKVIVNASPLSRVGWRVAAVPDCAGLVCSQQLFGVWPKEEGDLDILSIAAIINSPLASAFLWTGYLIRGFRIETISLLPLPGRIDQGRLGALVEAYGKGLGEVSRIFSQDRERELESLLLQIDAEVLRGYDLPPRLERQLLNCFRGKGRPVVHHFGDYFPKDFTAWIPLYEYLSDNFRRGKGRWIEEVFKSVEGPEARILGDYLL